MDVVIDMTEGRQLPNHKEARGVLLRNRMTPQMAINEIQKKAEAAKQQADAEANAQRQRELDEKADAVLPKIRIQAALHRRTLLSYKGYNIIELVDPLAWTTVSRCGFAPGGRGGVSKIEESVLWSDVSETSIQKQGLKTIASAEPHEKSKEFAIEYVHAKLVNEAYIHIAAHLGGL